MQMGKSVKMAGRKGRTPAMGFGERTFARRIVYLSKEEVERFFSVIPSENVRDRLLFDAIYRYGLRRREATLIRVSDLSEDRIWITRLKGSISSEYPVHPVTRRLLWRYLPERTDGRGPYLFVTRQSSAAAMSVSTIYWLFRRYADAASIPRERQHPHALRHSIATHLLDAGWDIADVQDWLGHAEIASTLVYAKVTNKRREARYEELLLSSAIAANNAS
jgi:integrase/recombinase XerD